MCGRDCPAQNINSALWGEGEMFSSTFITELTSSGLWGHRTPLPPSLGAITRPCPLPLGPRKMHLEAAKGSLQGPGLGCSHPTPHPASNMREEESCAPSHTQTRCTPVPSPSPHTLKPRREEERRWSRLESTTARAGGQSCSLDSDLHDRLGQLLSTSMLGPPFRPEGRC